MEGAKITNPTCGPTGPALPVHGRLRRWEKACLGALLVALLALHLKITAYYGCALRGHDGQYYYATLRSLVFDGDFDFRNEILELSPHRENLTPEVVPRTGRIANKFAAGWALVAMPLYLLVHAAMSLASRLGGAGPPLTGYELPYQLAATISHLLAGWLGLVVMYRLARRFFAPFPCAAALGCMVIGTPILFYNTDSLYMTHASGVLAVSVFACLCLTLAEPNGASRLRWAALGATGGLLLTMRYTNGVFGILLGYPVYRILSAGNTGGAGRRLLGGLAIAALASAPFLAFQSLLWYRVYGAWLTYSYGSERFAWLAPRIAGVLFSHEHGLMFFCPVYALAIAGLVGSLAVRPRVVPPAFAVCLAGSLIALTYVIGAWPGWWGGQAFGPRYFVEASAMFCLGLAWLFSTAKAGWKAAYMALGGASCAWTMILLALQYAGQVAPDGSTTLSEILRAILKRAGL